MIIREKNIIENDIPKTAEILDCIKEFLTGAERLQKLDDYYANKGKISERARKKGLPNNQLAHAYPQYIVSVASGYLVGAPVQYSAEQDIEALTGMYRKSKMASVDSELAESASIYGVGVELLYIDEHSAIKSAKVERPSAFVVYDDTVEAKPLLGIRWICRSKGSVKSYKVFAYTNKYIFQYKGTDLQSLSPDGTPEQHYFDGVPLVEYWNNGKERGDFESVLPLIDAYDLLQSDRVNDKQQFVESLLVITGARELEAPEDPDDTRSTAQRIREDKILAMPDGTTVSYLNKQLNEADVEVLRTSIARDIHKFSHIPDLSDENFAGNTSGVAMKYKLFGLEQLTKVKERWFEEGLRQRLGLVCSALRLKSISVPDAEDIQISFSRSLPVNEMEVAQMVRTLSGLVPEEVLLSQVPFIKDVKLALDMLDQERGTNPEPALEEV